MAGASAPPMDMPLNAPLPPSYEEAVNHPLPQYAPLYPHPQPDFKGNPPPYPVQQMPPPVSSPPLVAVQTVYVQSAVVFSDRPVQVNCPTCRQTVVTQLDFGSGTLAWLTCAGLFIFGCVYGCCLIPFCVDSLKDVTHSCPNCHSVLGVHKRL
ncbi:lipopolysaccharide-induced tumor necrosis factor-alpha factor homolog [Amia ocellicauda]|uniref:lipopolysaccharide-induced tumor necrosis factor-alpha factor homolog n=1 Tax=Amia ocellicauda TaxID=2972642 RepID=UPI0034643A38